MYPRIKELRETTNMSAKSFAAELDIPYTTYYGYESGAREPGHSFLMQFADRFDVTIDYLLGRTNDPHETYAKKKTPEPAATDSRAEEGWLTNLLIERGYIKPGEDISDRDAEFLIHIAGLIDAWFDK